MTTSSEADFHNNLAACAAQLDAIYARCAEAYSNFGLSPAEFREAVIRAVDKYLVGDAGRRGAPSTREIRKFISELQDLDLYLALACARGNEQAWWEFDRQHRTFIERWTRHLVRGGTEADEVIDSVYVELFGTKMVAGERQSKFRTYTGRGTLRGWLRTIILHAVIDLYRTRKAEIPLEDWLGTTDENDRQAWPAATRKAEESMLTGVVRERYRSATIAALDHSLATLDDHEKLLLLYYHVEGLKLREIARIVEEPMSPIRRWFSRRRVGAAPGRVHESTVMRWLERVYRKVADRFHSELANKHGLNAAEIEICKVIATEDPAQGLKLERSTVPNEGPPKTADEKVRVEGAS